MRARPDLVMVLVVIFGVGTFGMNFQMTMALMATEIYHKGPENYGLLGSIMAALALVPIGVIVMTILTAANAYIQTTVDPHMRGRVLSLYVMILMGGTPAGAPVIGWVADAFGARWSLLGGGILTIACTCLAALLFARRSGITVRPQWRPRPRFCRADNDQ
ncbi:MAG: MFS transporter [Pseudonocardiaceae bacterium]